MDIKVYHILDHFIPEYSGYTFRTRYILKNQREHGIKPIGIISPLYTEGLKCKEIIDEIEFNRSIFNHKAIKHNIPFLKQYQTVEFFKKDICRFLKDKPRGIIHAHSPVLNALASLSVARKLAMPFVYEVRAFWEDAAVDMGKTNNNSLRYKITKTLETKVLKNADRVITICEGLKKDMVGRGIDKDKIWVVPNGVNLDVFKPRPRDEKLAFSFGLEGKIVLGFIGSFYNYEGLDLLIKAMPEISKVNKNIVLLLVGAGETEENLKSLARELNLGERVIFAGKVPHSEVRNYYSVIDILLYPRIRIRLTDLVTPLKPLEAMAMGKAVIGSNAGGIAEIIKDGENGLLFEAGSIEGLASKVSFLAENPSYRGELAAQGREYVINNRNWDSIIRKHFKVYEGLLN